MIAFIDQEANEKAEEIDAKVFVPNKLFDFLWINIFNYTILNIDSVEVWFSNLLLICVTVILISFTL